MQLAYLRVPPTEAQFRTARMVAASVARQARLPIDLVEDVKLAVNEACALHRGALAPLELVFDLDDERLEVTVGPSAAPAVAEPESQMALTILRAVVPDFEAGDNGLRLAWPVSDQSGGA
ncbi:MAG: ATP-binding protein [Candidatus Nanopelagicales bacterium]